MKKRGWLYLISGALFLGVAFQNCAPSGMVFEDVQRSEEAAFFNYPYKSAPRFYGDILLFQQEGSVASLEDFEFVGMASLLEDRSASVSYSITVVNPDNSNETLCPQHDGTLSSGESTIQFHCTTSKQFQRMKIVMILQSGTASTTVEKTYLK